MSPSSKPGSQPQPPATRRTLRYAGAAFLALTSAVLFYTLTNTQAGQHNPGTERQPTGRPAADTKAGTGTSAAVQTARNLGKAYYEQGKYPEAITEFKRAMASGRALATDHLDLGLALLQANDLDAALGELNTAKQMDRRLVNIDYALGILYKRELRDTDAEAALKRVTDADPSDPAAWFNLGTVYFSEAQHAVDPELKSKKLEEALATHRHVVEMGLGRGQNFYVASLFHTFTILTRLRQQAEAQKVLKIHAQVRDKVPNISLQSPALEGGKYGAILVPAAASLPLSQSSPPRVSFSDVTARDFRLAHGAGSRPLPGTIVKHFGPSLAVGAYDNKGYPDVYVINPAGANLLYRHSSDSSFTDQTLRAGVAGPGGTISATFADYDNSGHASLFLAGANGITLYHNNGNGTFTDATRKAGLAGKPGEVDTEAVLFDADDDGYLDLVVTAYAEQELQQEPAKFPGDLPGATSHFYRNNGDGTFTEATASSGLSSAKGRMRGVVVADFNNDGYADLVFLRDDGAPLLYLNQGEDKFVERTSEAGEAFLQSRAFQAQAADFNRDGSFDLVLWSTDGYQVLLNRGGARFEAVEHLPPLQPPPDLFAFRGTVADVDGDGFDDLLAADTTGKLHFLANRAGRFQEAPLSLPAEQHPFAVFKPAWLTDPGKLNLLALAPNGALSDFEKKAPAAHWLEVKLDGYKSNKGGAGTIVELKAGNFYKKVQAAGGPLRVFTGDLPKLDVVRVTWPNAIVQNNIEVATNKSLEVRESERLASSCPFLYVWDGRRFRFFTDILGVAPLGELLPDGTRMKPNPEEFIKLGQLSPHQDGDYLFQVTDEMREADYLDQLRLFAVDHPDSEEVYADEIYSSSPVRPSLYAVRARRFPTAAVDDQGNNVLTLIRAVDGRYPAGFHRHRILGLADLHALTLDLGDVSNREPLALYLTGWVFWTDSNASRALMTNSQLQMIPPYLQVRDGQGKWVTVIPEMGLPSGTNRTMRLDLTGKFLSRDRQVRIVTNFCVYWDQIFFTTHENRLPNPVPAAGNAMPESKAAASAPEDSVRADADLALLELPLASADLHYRGFSAVTSDSRHVRPDYFEYTKLMAEAPWTAFAGRYTRYGPVEKLVGAADNRLVVMATGDEMTLRFEGRHLPPLKPGWKRDFFLYARGYAKDGEPNTAYFRTVEPLPFFEMDNYPYGADRHYPDNSEQQEYLREYETRAAHALIPPLAPAPSILR